MKNIQAQYTDLLEGKMSKANFMRNVRMQFPQYVTNVSSFEDSVKILKGKRILSEDLKVVKEPNPNAGKFRIMSIDGKKAIANDFFDSMEAAQEYAKKNIRTSHKIVKLPAERSVYRKAESLSEAKEGVYGHNPNAEAEVSRGIDHLNYYQVYNGMQYELAKMPEITDEAYIKARKKVVDTILKNPDAYKELQVANFKAVKEMDEDLKMKEVKEGNKVDKANGMKVMKKDAKENTQSTLEKKEKRKAKNGKGLQHMTQTPKGKLEAFATPGKEKVMALKEHILDELTNINPQHEHINVGSRVKKKDAKEYDASKVGNVTEFDGDTATVKWDNDSIEHVQTNVLTKKDIPQHPGASSAFSKLPDLGAAAEKGLKDMKEVEEKVEEGVEERKSKLKALKEKLVKALGKEGYAVQTATGQTLSAGRNTGQGITTARDLERATGDELTVLDTKTGKKTQA